MESEERIDLLAEVADMYYIQDLTQLMIAKKTGFSRSAISRILAEAKEKGIVEFCINYPIRRNNALEEDFKKIFGIETVFIIRNDGSSYMQTLRKIGKAAAMYIDKQLPDIKRFGVSWGTATYESVNNLSIQHLPNLEVIQMLGAVGEGNPKINGAEIVHLVAEKLGAIPRVLHAPLISDSIATAQIFKNESQIREIISLSDDMEVAVVGVGTLDLEYSSLKRAGYLSDEFIQKIIADGAVGDVCANHYDENGNILDIEINNRIVGMDMKLVRNSNCKIVGVAAGKHKALPILGALRGKLVNVLVIDDEAANTVIRLNSES